MSRTPKNKAPLVHWFLSNAEPGRTLAPMLTTAGNAVELVNEGFAYLRRREAATTLTDWRKSAFEAYRLFTAAKRRIEESQSPEKQLLILNANRDGKRGKVYTLGTIAASRFAMYRVPQVVLREDSILRTERVYSMASALYWEGVPVAPLARISPRLLVSVHLGDNIMQLLGEHAGSDLDRIERKLFNDLYALNCELADRIKSIRAPSSPRVETVDALLAPMLTYAQLHDVPIARHKRELRREIERNIRSMDDDWPFVDSSLRNFGIHSPDQERPLTAYLRGDGRIIQYDPDRFHRLSARSFNLSNLVFQHWRTLPLQDRIANEDERFLHGALHYLARQMSRAAHYGITKTGAVSTEIERHTLDQQRRELSQILDHPELRGYPLMRDILTTAATSQDH